MRLQILQVPDCPNVAVLRQRLDEALADTTLEAEVTIRVVKDSEEATSAGMTGSPTVLIDGTDPFAEPGRDPAAHLIRSRWNRSQRHTSAPLPSC